MISMRTLLSLPRKSYDRVINHLLPRKADVEEAAVVFVSISREDGVLQMNYEDWYPIPPEGFVIQSLGYIELADKTRAEIIKKAHDLGTAIVEFHSHPYAYDACFSWSDLRGLDEFVPHVWWRLKGKPYGAVVFGPWNFDALLWVDGPEHPRTLDELRVGDSILFPTNITLRHWGEVNEINAFQ